MLLIFILLILLVTGTGISQSLSSKSWWRDVSHISIFIFRGTWDTPTALDPSITSSEVYVAKSERTDFITTYEHKLNVLAASENKKWTQDWNEKITAQSEIMSKAETGWLYQVHGMLLPNNRTFHDSDNITCNMQKGFNLQCSHGSLPPTVCHHYDSLTFFVNLLVLISINAAATALM